MASRRRSEEWSLRLQLPTDDLISFSTKSRRFSGSYVPSTFREDNVASFCSFKDEIDPSTYSFTTALKALQGRAGINKRVRGGDEGLALHSKWEEAEKYICNPLSGQVPLECLSSKALSSTTLATSAPLLSSSNPTFTLHHHHLPMLTTDLPILHSPIQEKRMESSVILKSRDIGTQSTPSVEKCDSAKDDNLTKAKQKEERKKKEMNNKCATSMQGGCLSWIITKRHAHLNHKSKPQKTSLPLAV